MSLSPSQSSFFGLEAGLLRGLQACGVQPNTSVRINYYYYLLIQSPLLNFIWFLTGSFFMLLLETFLLYLTTKKKKFSSLVRLFSLRQMWLIWVRDLWPIALLLEWELENSMCCLYLVIHYVLPVFGYKLHWSLQLDPYLGWLHVILYHCIYTASETGKQRKVNMKGIVWWCLYIF